MKLRLIVEGIKDGLEELLEFRWKAGGDFGTLAGGELTEREDEVGERGGVTAESRQGFLIVGAKRRVAETGLGAGEGELAAA